MKVDIARLLYIGKVLFNYSEKEVWRMTLGKLAILYREWKKDRSSDEDVERPQREVEKTVAF